MSAVIIPVFIAIAYADRNPKKHKFLFPSQPL